MQIYKGKSVFGGIAIGKISVYKKDEQLPVILRLHSFRSCMIKR